MIEPVWHLRPYQETDYPMILGWWMAAQEPGPPAGAMIEDGTFVIEHGGMPVGSLTVFLTQSKQIAYFEGLIARPGLSKEIRRQAVEMLWNHGYQYADSRGYRTVLTYAQKQKLVDRYEALGMTRAQTGLTALFRSL